METDIPQLRIELREVSKKFGREWVLKQHTATYVSGGIYGIRGRNGSGKSTLLRIIAGQLSPSRGDLKYTISGHDIPVGDIFRYVSWTGPYLEMVEELSVIELLEFNFTMKPLVVGLTPQSICERIGLGSFRDRKLTDCSSGMRQRVMLATALYAATPLLILDEPTVTLDFPAAEWFFGELDRFATGRLTVIASNDARDLVSCSLITDL
ncbi:ABC-type multidrug transport system ATPase subunit [Lewinella aquimaris]|uniref:ABC-type multidrug transport system ATPase subunit n=1 Tax=Neolewinella aquimaris TaxID=1835722 RepID=A0A840E7C9_9BACT|nr:ATP-binding cassette domain-containing protein [Neolewinella aquimaris]MBB4077709.1 ABC-type multidrug transport system ATPase subunit [Neolewinella aquimaris]